MRVQQYGNRDNKTQDDDVSDLDVVLPEVVRAKLAGVDIQSVYPDVHDYLRTSARARRLWKALLRAEMRIQTR
jgi:hypothetical protein